MARWLVLGVPTLLLCLSRSAVVSAQVVQLPVIHQFSISTTVVVPDRGSVVIGGVDRYRASSVSLGSGLPGLPPNRAFGYDVSRRQATVAATVIDHQEWDRAVLEAARQHQALAGSSTEERVVDTTEAANPRDASLARRYLPPYAAGPAKDNRPLTAAELRALRQQKQQAWEQMANARLDQARRLAADGKVALAQSILKRLLSDAQGDMRREIEYELHRLSQ